MLHPDTGGLIIAKFRQTTSRSDDPDLHTHSVISNKVRTADGRWRALDGAYLKKHQRMLGGIYQSALRNELSHTLGFEWEPIVNGQAEIAGIPKDVLRAFSKRTVRSRKRSTSRSRTSSKGKVATRRHGNAPRSPARPPATRVEEVRQRCRRTTTRWTNEAQALGWTGPELVELRCSPPPNSATSSHRQPHRARGDRPPVGGGLGLEPRRHHEGHLRPQAPGRIAGRRALGRQSRASVRRRHGSVHRPRPVDTSGPTRESDGRSLTTPPIARHFTSERILAEEDFIISWAIAAQEVEPTRRPPSTSTASTPSRPKSHEPSPDTTDSSSSSAPPAPARPPHSRSHHRPSPLRPARVRRRSLSQGRPCPRTGDRHAPDTLAKLLYEWERTDRVRSTHTVSRRDHGHRRRSRHGRHHQPHRLVALAQARTGASSSSATPASSKPSAVAACSTSSASPAAP